jgi:hypothetical protein
MILYSSQAKGTWFWHRGQSFEKLSVLMLQAHSYIATGTKRTCWSFLNSQSKKSAWMNCARARVPLMQLAAFLFSLFRWLGIAINSAWVVVIIATLGRRCIQTKGIVGAGARRVRKTSHGLPLAIVRVWDNSTHKAHYIRQPRTKLRVLCFHNPTLR